MKMNPLGKTRSKHDKHIFVEIKIEPPHDKTNEMIVRPAKTQISLGIRPVWSESSPWDTQADLSLRCSLIGEDPRTQAFFMRTAKTLIGLGGCPG